jgi:hypothetical protein
MCARLAETENKNKRSLQTEKGERKRRNERAKEWEVVGREREVLKRVREV